MAGFGRYGPYVEHDGKYVKIDADEVFTIGQNRAVTVIAEGSGKAQAARTSTPIKALGEHPELGGKIEVLAGRFGPYIKFGKVNATVPKDYGARGPDTGRSRPAHRSEDGKRRLEDQGAREGQDGKAESCRGEWKRNSEQVKGCQEAENTGQEDTSKSGNQGSLAVPRKKDNMDVKVKRAEPARSKVPTKEDILHFIRSATTNIGRREIARAFDIKGSDRIDLKRMLKELAADGLIADPRRGMRKETLPKVAVIVVRGQDRNGDLIASPLHWNEDEDGGPPRSCSRSHGAMKAQPSAWATMCSPACEKLAAKMKAARTQSASSLRR